MEIVNEEPAAGPSRLKIEQPPSSPDENDGTSSEAEHEHFDDRFTAPVHSWIIDTKILGEYLTNVAKCATCDGTLQVLEEVTYRAGLGTKLHFSCMNSECTFVSSGFFTTRKDGKKFDINTQLVLGGRFSGKGRSGLEKISTVVGLHNPVSHHPYREKTKHLEEEAANLLDKNLSEAGQRARQARRP